MKSRRLSFSFPGFVSALALSFLGVLALGQDGPATSPPVPVPTEAPKKADPPAPTGKPAAPPTPSLGAAPVVDADTAKKPGGTKEGEYTGKVVVIPVGEEDLISPARFEFMSRAMKRATDEGAEAVIFDLDTPGGLAWETTSVVMKDLQTLVPRSLAYVNPRALSAGAIIAMGTDVIYMSPASSIGAATPIISGGEKLDEAERAKMNSAFMAMARTAVVSKGHNPAVIEAMIDKDVGLKIGDEEVLPKGRILTLDQQQAVKVYGGKPLLAKGIVRDLAELAKKEGLTGEIIVAEPKGFELVAIWITKYAAILLLIGLAGGYLEMQSPGFGIPGIISATAFGLFFFGHYVAGSLIGYETVFVFCLGILLVIVEVFVLPGHIIPGLLGLLLVVGSIIYTMSGWDVNIPEGGTFPVRLEDYAVAVRNLGLAFAGALALAIIFMRYFPSAGPFQRLVLHTAVGGAQSSIEGHGQSKAALIQVGAVGVTRSAMRPYGNVDFSGITIEAMAEGDLLPPGVQVKVRSIQGGKVIVEKV